jgi:hypothetical protein
MASIQEELVTKAFKGKIALDIRNSKPDWPSFLDPQAPKGAPNVLVILYDDTGCAAWSTYGGRINMPTLDRLAKNGLTYTQWHTTAVCSPTRSTMLTGRNHHQNGFGTIAESAAGFPGYSGHIPPENATMATVLRDAGYTTLWIGKNHNVPVDAFDIGASRKHWPLGLGYDRFYGFIGGETNQWYPELIEDNHLVEQAGPARGGLSPLQGSGRQGDPVHPGHDAGAPREALVPVVLPRRQPRAAPRAAGVHRQVQGRVRRRLRGLSRVGADAHDRSRRAAQEHGADSDQPDGRRDLHRGRFGPPLGHAQR